MSRITFIPPKLDFLETNADGILCLFRFQEKQPLKGINSLIDWRLLGHLSTMIIEDFITSHKNETVLLPLGKRLSPSHLLIIGLGDPRTLNPSDYKQAFDQLFFTIEKLGFCEKTLFVSLPGRCEQQCPATESIQWFLEVIDALDYPVNISLIEPAKAQKEMTPAVEGWRLKHSVPQRAGN